MAFGDVTVEDSRNLTTNNSRKIIRLAQCQVEYLLHVQETLVHHKVRDRGPGTGHRDRDRGGGMCSFSASCFIFFCATAVRIIALFNSALYIILGFGCGYTRAAYLRLKRPLQLESEMNQRTKLFDHRVPGTHNGHAWTREAPLPRGEAATGG